MSDLTASHCGCERSQNESNCGCSTIIWIIILLFLCNNNGSGILGGCGGCILGGCGEGEGMGCECIIIIILLLFFCCGNKHDCC